MTLTLICAVASDGSIGLKGTLPWHIPEDLKHFKALTTGHSILMGRKTYESIGRPLPNRRNIVITRDASRIIPGCEVVTSIEAALALTANEAEVFVIGGAEIYKAALPLATRLELTTIERVVNGDVHFPEYDRSQWKEVSRREGETAGVTFVTLERM